MNVSGTHFQIDLTLPVSDIFYTTQETLFTTNYLDLLSGLYLLTGKDALLQPSYQSSVLRPLIRYIENMGEDNFNKLFGTGIRLLNRRDRAMRFAIQEVSDALLQRNHSLKYLPSSFKDLEAFQSIVDALFYEVTKRRISQQAQGILPPLAKWGKGSKGPYAMPQAGKSLKEIGIISGIVSLPLAHQKGGLLAWSSIGHEVAGHHFLRSVQGLIPEIKDAIKNKFLGLNCESDDSMKTLASYWEACAEEITCDILGLLNIGPSFGLGLVGYLRGVRGGSLRITGPLYSTERVKAKNGMLLEDEAGLQIFVERLVEGVSLNGKEGNLGFLAKNSKQPLIYKKINTSDFHPVDVLRPLVIAKVLNSLKLQPQELQDIIEKEAFSDLKDKQEITFYFFEKGNEKIITKEKIIELGKILESIETLVDVLINSEFQALENKKLTDFFRWSEEDQCFADVIIEQLSNPEVQDLKHLPLGKFYARHIVGASILASCKKGNSTMQDIETIFRNMKHFLVGAMEKEPLLNRGAHITFDENLSDELEDEDEFFQFFS